MVSVPHCQLLKEVWERVINRLAQDAAPGGHCLDMYTGLGSAGDWAIEAWRTQEEGMQFFKLWNVCYVVWKSVLLTELTS